jgi:succinyl-diaminopimelate desuccinylase
MTWPPRSSCAAHPGHPGTRGLLLTSDEEGPSVHGTVHVVRGAAARGERLDACIVGEPTSVDRVGDMVKNGRRGTLSGRLVVQGRAGPHRLPAAGAQPHPRAAPALAELAAMRWDEGNAYFLPTSWQVSNITPAPAPAM